MGLGGGVISGAGRGANKWGQGGEAHKRRFMVSPSLKGWCFLLFRLSWRRLRSNCWTRKICCLGKKNALKRR